MVEAPERWNGVLLVYCHPVPVGEGQPPWEPEEALANELIRHGYAIAGSSNTIFWPLEQVLVDQPVLLDVAEDVLGRPDHVIGVGLSIGGIITAGAVQLFPHRLSGALPMCGNLAGAVSNHNRELDIAFVVKTLLAPDSALRLVHVPDSQANLAVADSVLRDAQATDAGRARLALAAAVGNIPGWHDPTSPEPAPDDFEGQQRNQFALFDEVGFLVYFLGRRHVEIQARGNPSWNTDIDYRERLAQSFNREEVCALYAMASLNLEQDLDRLASEPRIEPDLWAVEYLERHIVFNGDVGGIPVLTMHTDGDGLVTPDHEHAYSDIVNHAGNQDFLRQVYVHRGGHCTFTLAEILTGLDVLLGRIQGGRWPDTRPEAMNEAARRFGAQSRLLVSAQSQLMVSGHRTDPHFVGFEPWPFPRPYDVRDVRSRAAGSA